MSNPPHRDFPIEWRTETGEFISQPVPGQPAEEATPAGPPHGQPAEPYGQPPAGPTLWGQPPPVQQSPGQPPPWGQALPGQHIGPPPAPPQSRDEPLSAGDLLGVRVAAPDEHRAATRLQMAVLALVLIGLSLTWATGGLEKVPGYLPDDGIRTVAVGEQVDTGPFRITVEQAAVFTEYGDQRAYEDGGTILIVTVTVENLGDETAYIGSTALGNTAIALDGVRGIKRADPNQVVSMRDGSTLSQVQPGLPERVGYVWELNAGAEPPQEIGVLLYGATWRRSSFIHLNPVPTWWERGPRARTTVTVQDRAGRLVTAPTQGPATHRRRPGRWRRAGRAVGAVLLVLVTLAAGHEIIQGRPDRSVTFGPFLRSGGVGDRVESLELAATVVSVRGGRAVLTERHEEFHTDGLWLLVRVRVEALRQPNQASLLVIHDRRGRTFSATGRFMQPTLGYSFQPDIPVEADLVFEVPRDAVPDAHLRFGEDTGVDLIGSTMIDVDLGLDEGLLREFLTVEDAVHIEPLEVKL